MINIDPLAGHKKEHNRFNIVLGKKINHSGPGGWIFSKVHPPRQ